MILPDFAQIAKFARYCRRETVMLQLARNIIKEENVSVVDSFRHNYSLAHRRDRDSAQFGDAEKSR